MKVAVVQFPGSNCDQDTLHVLKNVLKLDAHLVWHEDFNDPTYDAAVLPGGFSFGDHLRGGIIAAYSPAMDTVKKIAAEKKPVLGICNGFQTLIEAGLLPGALLRNSTLKFVCDWFDLEVGNTESAFSRKLRGKTRVRIPIAHNEGRFFADDEVMDRLERDRRVVLRYAGVNPTGTSRGIAAICNELGNVVGMMPHPERASDPLLGGTDGLSVFQSMLEWG